MLTIFKKILYLILLNVCIINNNSSASFFSFFKKLTSSNDNNNEQVLDKNNKPIELKIQVNSSILKQIKEINNILENKNDNNKVKDSNFDIIQTQQQHILGVLGIYYYNKDVFNKCTVKVNSTISVIDFYNTLFRKRNDFSKLIVELHDILKDQYSKSISELYKSFNKMLNIVNLINLIFNEKNNGGLVNSLLLLDNTVGLNENEIKNILNPYFHQLDLVLDKDTINYYSDVLSEVNVKIRQKNSVLPSQLLFILFNNIREELFIKNNELYESYIFFKNKITLINQKLDSINTYIRDTKQLSNNSENNKKSHEEAIVNLINSNIKEQNRSNNDVIDEIERIQSVIDDIIESLNDFKNYVPDERILSAIEQAKINKKESKIQNSNVFNSKDNITSKTNNTTSKTSNNNDNKIDNTDISNNKQNNTSKNNNDNKSDKQIDSKVDNTKYNDNINKLNNINKDNKTINKKSNNKVNDNGEKQKENDNKKQLNSEEQNNNKTSGSKNKKDNNNIESIKSNTNTENNKKNEKENTNLNNKEEKDNNKKADIS